MRVHPPQHETVSARINVVLSWENGGSEDDWLVDVNLGDSMIQAFD